VLGVSLLELEWFSGTLHPYHSVQAKGVDRDLRSSLTANK
jgi:hypothetical protein